MKDLNSAEVAEIIEEADEDLADAARLAGHSAPAARYAASQAAEKYLRALCEAMDRPAGIMWDIGKVFETVRDVAGLEEIAEATAMLGKFTTPARSGDGRTIRMQDVIYAARSIRWTVRAALGCSEPRPEKPAETATECASSEVIDSAMIPEDDDMIPTILPDDGVQASSTSQPSGEPAGASGDRRRDGQGHRNDHPDARPGRSSQERDSSFVKVFLVCDRCGVRIPRTRQTAVGRVPCSMCGRPMKLQK